MNTSNLATQLLGSPRPLTFVLSGGGAYGAVQVGMLQALAEAGIKPDRVVGSSVGALNGAFVAADPDGAPEQLRDIWGSVEAADVFGTRRRGTRRLGMMQHLAKSRSALLSAEAMTALIDRYSPAATFDGLALPFASIATDHRTGDPVILNQGQLAPALRASAAIPGVFPAQELDGKLLVDGGVVAMFPTVLARALGAETIVLLDATPSDPRPEEPQGLTDSLIHTVALMIRTQRRAAVDPQVVGCPVFSLRSATPPDATAFDFSRTLPLINDGYQRARGHLHG